MRIANNIMALNAHRQLLINQHNAARALAQLSSGLRINRAADDPAGLAISERMRGQIRGLRQATRNAQDAISLIQTAEGALNESHAILHRMRELAIQAANDTNTAGDRFYIQTEINQLTDELSRIGNTTEFNTMTLLDGSFSGKKFHIGANSGQNVGLTIEDMRAEALGVVAGTAVWSADAGKTSFDLDGANASIDNLVAGAYRVEVSADGAVSLRTQGGVEIGHASSASVAGDTITVTVTHADYLVEPTTSTITLAIDVVSDGGASPLYSTESGTISLYVLGQGQGISVMNQADADVATTTIDNAIQAVSSQRSTLGAMQNRLTHTVANLSTMAENLQAAESRIRDVDMAAAMMEFVRNQILGQVAMAMLAQANLSAQMVLQLLP